MASAILSAWVLKYGTLRSSSRKGVRWPTAVKPSARASLHTPHELLPGVADDVVVDAGPVAHAASHELVRGHAEVLARDVPKGDVDGAECAHDCRAAEVAGPVHVLPVVLDQEGVLADEVAAELVNGGGGGLEEAPCAGLAVADDTGVGVDLGEQVAVDREGFYGGYLHMCDSLCLGRGEGGFQTRPYNLQLHPQCGGTIGNLAYLLRSYDGEGLFAVYYANCVIEGELAAPVRGLLGEGREVRRYDHVVHL